MNRNNLSKMHIHVQARPLKSMEWKEALKKNETYACPPSRHCRFLFPFAIFFIAEYLVTSSFRHVVLDQRLTEKEDHTLPSFNACKMYNNFKGLSM